MMRKHILPAFADSLVRNPPPPTPEHLIAKDRAKARSQISIVSPPQQPSDRSTTVWSDHVILTDDENVEQAARDLARQVADQLGAEERLRQINDPFPLPVRWTNGPEHVTDHWENILGSTEPTGAISLASNLEQIVDTFNSVPSRRLVVLGPAGAGKSILAVRFALDFLGSRPNDSPVPLPVVFRMATWDPVQQSLRDWMVERLTAEYSVLRQRSGRRTTFAAELVQCNRILPVLDGFDELAPGLRSFALRTLNASLSPGYPLVLTSRHDEYDSAVDKSDVLTAAAVVQLEGLTLDDLANYLPRTARKVQGGGGLTKWNPVLDRLRNHHNDQVAKSLCEVLSTPLMVALARAVYSDTSANPAELLNVRMFPDTAAVSNHLLDGFPAATYDVPPRDQHRNRKNSSWNVRHINRWLEFLALRAHMTAGREVVWWKAFGVSQFFLPVILLSVLGASQVFADLPDYVNGAILGLIGGLSVQGMLLTPTEASRTLRRTQVRLKLPNLAMGLRRGAMFGGLYAALIIVAGGLTLPWSRSQLILVYFAPMLLAGIVIISVLDELTSSPVDMSSTVSSSAVFRATQIKASIDGVVSGIVVVGGGSVAHWIFFGRFPYSIQLISIISAGWMCGNLLSSVWGLWLQMRIWWVLTGRAPWRFFTFLEDAYRRGVFRQSGGVYQFRHALLHDRLTNMALGHLSARAKRRRGILVARSALAIGWGESGKMESAEAEFQSLLSTARRKPFSKRLVLVLRHNFACLRLEYDDLHSALVELRDVLKDKQRRLGYRHRSTLLTWCMLAEALAEAGQSAESTKELKSLLRRMPRLGDENNAYVIEARRQLAIVERLSPVANE